ncbi:MAG: NUDIX domain-containing protein [Oscillospiraceae bacterium]|nr:NUDIX domain-containing protein [Oscillospiraceae bacterium]
MEAYFNTEKFCIECGKSLVYKSVGDEGEQRYCPRCDKFYFDNPACCVLVAIVNENNKVLLLKQNYISGEKYTLCSGYVKKGETLEETVEREVKEETGCMVKKCEYIDSYYYPPKGLIMPGFIAYVDERWRLSFMSKEVDELLWVELDKAADMVLRVNNFSGKHLDNVIKKITGKYPVENSGKRAFSSYTDSHGAYVVSFNEIIYDDPRDSEAYDEIVDRVIKPDSKGGLFGGFYKDNIMVRTFLWDPMFGYFWQIMLQNAEDEKKVLGWAAAVSEEFLKLKEKVLSENNVSEDENAGEVSK